MKILPMLAAAALVLACNDRARESGDAATPGVSADTIVTKREVQDTAIITRDTIVRTDTVRKRGTTAVKTDTIKKP